MTLEKMGQTGYDQTTLEIKRFNKLLASQYQKALTDINKDIRKVYDKVIGDRSPAQVAAILKEQPTWLFNEANKFDRLQSLQKRVQDQFIKASIAAGNMTVESSKTAITNNFYRQQFALDFANASPINLSFSVLNPKVVEVSVLGTPKVFKELQKQTIDRISRTYGSLSKYQPKYGSLSSILTKNRAKDLQAIQSSITQGLIQGKGYRKTAQDVRKVLNGSVNQAVTVVRTESSRNSNAGAYASHNVALSQGLDAKRMAVETLDTRTRQQSQHIDGQLTDENDQFTYPGGKKVDIIGNSGEARYDVNERGRSIEVIDGQPPDIRRGRDPVTGKSDIMSYKNYDQWAVDNGLVKNATGRWIFKG